MIPKNARELELWLQINCKDDGKTKNLTSFAGGKKNQKGERVSNTSCAWWLFDNKRDELAEHFVRIYHDTKEGEAMPCLNMVLAKGEHLRIRPILDIEFFSDEVFATFLEHCGINEWQFYTAVRIEFHNVLGLQTSVNDNQFAFSRQPSKRHKFHIVYIGDNENLTWNKEEMRATHKGFGQFLTDKYRLKELEEKHGPMVRRISFSHPHIHIIVAQYSPLDS